ncbi:MAG: 3'(2'),5'-bisphosphate nucleotidase CysQ [Alistipes sp.]|nr:3'(2'),5'-bisphosphate nucleotidase CysQ [Alistipes sp.]MBQ2415770.1 3'(2'),5'-bisphosphate nucleotidase CysQ [Alistipes sp.]MBQ5898657.1 3'(2'),5'-bisphosphate nucleotidase CysQ [Alistipes sp.]
MTTQDQQQIVAQIREHLLPHCFNAAVKAGAAIMKIYKNRDDYDISLKSDHTPITMADRMAHNTIKDTLGPTRIPVLSEEGREMLYDERRNWELFLLVDPLDGTVEFIKGNNEFTVNIALLADNECVGSVLYVPYLEKMYVAAKGKGAYLIRNIAPSDNPQYEGKQIEAMLEKLPLEGSCHEGFRVALSRSHQTPETHQRVEELRAEHPDLEIVEQGSSYKFCLLAEGTVDYYVRTTHTYEWDTAAGELILSEAGGKTISYPDGKPLEYNKEDLKNPWFEAQGAKCR